MNKLHVEVETEEDDGKKTSSKVTVSDAVTLIVGKVKENIKVWSQLVLFICVCGLVGVTVHKSWDLFNCR